MVRMPRRFRSPRPRNFQYTLASLCCVIVAFALAMSLSQSAGYFSGFATVSLLLALLWTWRRARLRGWRMRYVALLSLLAVGLWFAAVDKYVKWYECPICLREGGVIEYRVCGLCLHRVREDVPGCPFWSVHFGSHPLCPGRPSVSLRQRYWGLLICACPCEYTTGIHKLSPLPPLPEAPGLSAGLSGREQDQ